MADISILDPAVHSAPKAYAVKGSQEIILKGVTASFDGTLAAGSFQPAVQVVNPAGVVVGTYTCGTVLTAGASADVSWFPSVGGGGAGTINDITSVDGSVTITGPTGPVTNLSVSSSTTTPSDGWISDSTETWTYASGAGGGLATFTVTGDVRNKYSSGTRIKLTQSATLKFFVVAADTTYAAGPNTSTVTIMGGSDYTLANSAITGNFHSHVVDPDAFPHFFNYSASPSGWSSFTSNLFHFYVIGHQVMVHYAVTGTSNSTASSFTLPITNGTLGGWAASISAADNGVSSSTPGRASISASSSTCTLDLTWTGGAWTAAGSKTTNGVIFYLF